MPNPILRAEIIKEVMNALQSFANIGTVDHSGLKGRIREIITEKLLKPLLPPGVETGSGKIIDSQGNQSAETDIIIYSRLTLPPLIYGHSTGLYPVEACIYSIEVKSILNATELQDTLKKVRRLRNLRYLESFYPHNFINPIGPACSFVIPALFAFSSDLSEDGISEIQRYRKYDRNADTEPLIPVMCIPKKGYWHFNYQETGKKWIHHSPTQDFDEIVDFIAGFANTVPVEIIKKGQPYYGHYIMLQRPASKE